MPMRTSGHLTTTRDAFVLRLDDGDMRELWWDEDDAEEVALIPVPYGVRVFHGRLDVYDLEERARAARVLWGANEWTRSAPVKPVRAPAKPASVPAAPIIAALAPPPATVADVMGSNSAVQCRVWSGGWYSCGLTDRYNKDMEYRHRPEPRSWWISTTTDGQWRHKWDTEEQARKDSAGEVILVVEVFPKAPEPPAASMAS